MKTTTKSILVACGLMAVLASCSNDINTPGSGDKEQPKGLQFSFTEEDYGEDEVLSRAAANKAPQTETVDLGDCEAEVSVESEPAEKHPQATTRTITNKHYTIRAYQVGVKKAEIRGTFNGTNFIADADSPQDMPLKQGEAYEFIAFNDNFTPSSGDKELIITRDKVATAYMGRTNVYIDQYKKQQINFEMKHVGSRLRTQFVCQKHIPNNITATLDTKLNNIIPTKETYNINDYEYNIKSLGSFVAVPNNSPASTEPKFTASNGGQTFAYTSTSNYHYFLPESKNMGFIKITFNAGTIFWKPLTGVIPWLSFNPISMKPNKSYVVKIKLKPKFRYLFSDGTTGFRSETTYGGAPAATAKIPIGLVVGSGIAMSLKSFENDQWLEGTNADYRQYNRNLDFNFQTLMSWENGYDETWNAANNTGNVKGNQAIPKGDQTNTGNFPAFYHAGHYTGYFISPIISPLPLWLQNTKWYLPAFGEWKYPFNTVAFGDMTALSGATDYGGLSCYSYFIENAITAVGGTSIMSKNHWTSSQNHPAEAGQVQINPTNMNWNRYLWIVQRNSVRAFIRY